VLRIFDTAGTSEFTAIRAGYMKEGSGFIVVYSVTSRGTFLALDDQREQIYQVKDKDDSEIVPIIIVGNKADLDDQRTVTSDEGEDWAQAHNCAFAETSAKTSKNVKEMFEAITKLVLTHAPQKEPAKQSSGWCALL
jgi:small GTP-binding protein